MWLKCDRCGNGSPVIAKYYPHTQWTAEDKSGALTEWFQQHHHDDFTPSGPRHFSLQWEEGAKKCYLNQETSTEVPV